MRSWCGQRLGAELGTEVWFVPVASKAGKETTARVLALCKSLPVQWCPEGERKGLKLVFGASHESQAGTGGQIQQSPVCSALGRGTAQASTALLAETCSVPAPVLLATLQESLRCFFCSWYSVIFCWKYTVDKKRSCAVTKHRKCQSCRIHAPLLVHGAEQQGAGRARLRGCHPGDGGIEVVAIPPSAPHPPQMGFVTLGLA